MTQLLMEIDREEIKKLNEAGRRHFQAILHHFNIKFADTGTRIYCSCPLPNHEGDRSSTTSFCFDYEKGIWACFSHGCNIDYGSDVVGFVKGMLGCSFSDACQYLKDFLQDKFNTDLSQIEVRVNNTNNNYVTHKPLPNDLIKYLQRYKCDYLINRGFSESVLKKFEVGYWFRFRDFMDQRVIVPVRDHEGNLVGFSGRLVFDKNQWLEKYPNRSYIKWLHGRSYIQQDKEDKFHKNSILYNLNNVIGNFDSVIIVEGPLDGFKLEMAGIKNWVATLGGAINPVRQYLLVNNGIKKVYLAFDADKAGDKYKDKTKELLQNTFDVQIINLPIPYDLGDLSIKTIRRAFKDLR